MTIKTKQQFYRMYERGLFGNKLKTWRDGYSILSNPPTCSITLRTNRSGGNKCAYNISRKQIVEVIENWIFDGLTIQEIVANESAPDDHLILQGELQLGDNGIYLLYSTLKDKMRVALSKDPRHLYGFGVYHLLKTYMTPSSYDDIIELLSIYPNNVIEFGIYDINLGDCRGRNTIIWESRAY